MRFGAEIFHYWGFYRKYRKIAVMKYVGPRNALAKYLASAKFDCDFFQEPKVALGKDTL